MNKLRILLSLKLCVYKSLDRLDDSITSAISILYNDRGVLVHPLCYLSDLSLFKLLEPDRVAHPFYNKFLVTYFNVETLLPIVEVNLTAFLESIKLAFLLDLVPLRLRLHTFQLKRGGCLFLL